MSRKTNFQAKLGAIGILIAIMGCQLTSPTVIVVTATPEPELTSSPTTPVEEEPTATNIAPATTEPATESPSPTALPTTGPTPTSGPDCVTLQRMNLRPGPGVAYREVILTFEIGTHLIPTGYNPEGVPVDPWVQVSDPVGNQVGWIRAFSAEVECTIDLNTLPEVSVPPPPPPPPPSIGSSNVDGKNIPEGWVSEVIFNPTYFVRMMVYDEFNGGTQDGDGITNVQFQVLDSDGNQVWERTESTPAYCIFAGGEPNCNPWVFEDYVYKWGQGGPAVEEGQYQLLITVNSEFDVATWNISVFIEPPY